VSLRVIDRLSMRYPDLLKEVLAKGADVESRVGMTRELIAYNLVLTEPKHCVVDRDGFSREFMDAEIAMLLAGVYDSGIIQSISRKAGTLMAPATAYGPRIKTQIFSARNELRNDRSSRRAVVYVGHADDLYNATTSPLWKGEMPCTMTWQFLVRDAKLHMIVNMRSWDLVWGLCYDVPSFVSVQKALSRDLKIPMGHYYHNAGSAHVYEHHFGVEARPNLHGKLKLDIVANELEQTRMLAIGRVSKLRGTAPLHREDLP